jgi:hypothetical protein
MDAEGLLPVCGKAHDLVAGRGGRTTRATFEAWLKANHVDLRELGLRYYEEATDG